MDHGVQTPAADSDGDAALLSRYAQTGCQKSFERIVARHGGWIFSLALRAVRDRHLAEDVTQATFIILARKAAAIRPGTPLSGWLFKAARFAVSDALKRRTRMKNRENRFAEFFKAANGEDGAVDRGGAAGDGASDVSDELSHTLDEALACLSDSDRQAVLLRFYEGKSLAEIGQIMGASEEAAKKRVSRAVEKLRKSFASRGVITTAAVVLMLLGRRSAEAATIAPAVVAPHAAEPACHAIADGALRLMAHAQARLLGAIFATGLAVLVAVPTLGGAIVKLAVTAPAAPATPTAPQDDQPLASPSYETVEVRTPKLPNDSRIADLWIGYKGEILWRSDAYTSTTPSPFFFKSGERQDKPYAVAVDPRGNFFIKPLDKAIMQSPAIRQGLFDYDTGPADPESRVQQMMSVIASVPVAASSSSSSRTSGHAAPAHDALASAADPGASDDANPSTAHGVRRAVGKPAAPATEKDWEQLRRIRDNDDGTVVVDQLAPRLFMMPDGDSIFQTNPFAPIEVPEPAATALALATLALLRRRRRHH